MKRSVLLFIILSLIVSYPGMAQERKITVQAGINIFNDPAVGPRSYVEFPFSLKKSEFAFIEIDSIQAGVRATIYAELIVSDTLGNHLDSASTYFYTGAISKAAAKTANIKIFNKLSLKLAAGMYSAKMTVIDVTNKAEGSFLYDRIEIMPVEYDKLNTSMIELAYNIRAIDDLETPNQRLVKSGREVIPNPMGVYSVDDDALYLYAEIYNLSYDSTNPGKYEISYKVYGEMGGLIADFGKFEREMMQNSAIASSRLSIKGWNPGKYDLKMNVTDLSSGHTAESIRRFIIFPKQNLPEQYVEYEFRSPLDTATVKTKSQLIKYLVTPEDLALYNSLNDTGKSRFVEEFFRDNDPTPNTKENEYLNDALARYVYAMTNFETLPDYSDGWKTDRGRVLMQYGAWDKLESVPAPVYGQMYEIWHYFSQQGGIYFIFSDVKGLGEFHLVHSNASGEVYDSEWENRYNQRSNEIIQGGTQFVE